MKRFKAALLAAAVTAGLPAMAMAQERPDRDYSRGQRDQGDRQQRGDDQQSTQRDRTSQQASDRQPVQQTQQAQQQQVQQQQAQQRTMEQRRDQVRDDRGGNDRRGPSGQAFGNYNGGVDRGRLDGRNDPRGRDLNGRDLRTEQYRGGNDRFAGNQGRWGGDWRRDNRYDWRGYRDSHRDIFRASRYIAPRGWSYGYRRFSIGVALPSFLFGQQYWIGDPGAYRLPPAYGPYRWVRYYDDVLLIDLRSGQVVDMIPGFFW